MCLFFRCTIINVEMCFAFAIRVGDELSRLMEHLLVLLDELRQKLTEIILREATWALTDWAFDQGLTPALEKYQ